ARWRQALELVPLVARVDDHETVVEPLLCEIARHARAQLAHGVDKRGGIIEPSFAERAPKLYTTARDLHGHERACVRDRVQRTSVLLARAEIAQAQTTHIIRAVSGKAPHRVPQITGCA